MSLLEETEKAAPSLKTNGDYYIWTKGENFKLSQYFATKEFACKCSYPECKEQRISRTLIGRLDNIRKDSGQPVTITSAYRCTKYQEYLRASGVNTVVAKKSTHELGDAVDAVPADRKMDVFETICAKYFDSIGLAKNFLHLDLRAGKRRWKY